MAPMGTYLIIPEAWGAPSPSLVVASTGHGEGAPIGRPFRCRRDESRYGVGSLSEMPSMSVLPKVAAQTVSGAGFDNGVAVNSEAR